jgi:hypothetical protein
MANLHNYSIIPPSAVYNEHWPQSKVLPQGLHGQLSVAGWTSGNEGLQHQTFLGASIRSFNVNAGFGDSSSTMGIELVNDEFNKSDNLGFGLGDDVYHGAEHDKFNPPVVGSPVFFKFGKNFATTEQAFRKDFDQIYGVDTLNIPPNPFPIIVKPLPVTTHSQGHYLMKKDLVAQTAEWIDKSVLLDPATKWRGFAHFAFGGILQSYTENRSMQGNPLYSVKLVDPREMLTNTQMVLNNYQGTTFNNKNLYNVYGFLEYDPSDKLVEQFDMVSSGKEVLTKNVDASGNVWYTGLDVYTLNPGQRTSIQSLGETAEMSGIFPVTGQGFSRRSENGIPWYRVEQAMNSLFSFDSDLPKEYQDAGFGGVIDFRGYNYVVDWTGIPTEDIPKTYYLDFDKINMMDLAQELCDVLSRELFVSLLPVIDHPACKFLYEKNKKVITEANALPPNSPERSLILGSGLVAGIIRIDSIDKKSPPTYGAVKSYLDDLESNDIFVSSRDVGFEVSNVTTDRFVVGAQEVDMYYFNTLRDRDNYLDRLKDTGDADAQSRLEQLGHDKWTLETNQNQQVLPFYGFLGDKAVTIPRGFGSYQQILLDARGLDAHGVGAYYVATEMELRAAEVSFKAWMNFLLTYNEVYIQELSNNQAFFASLSMDMTEEVKGINSQLDPDSPIKEQLDILTEGGRNFGVSVPRSVWNSDKSPNDSTEDVVDDYGQPEPEDPNDPNSPNKTREVGGQCEGKMGKDGYPASPCNPPFGYPLYYKRAEKIGIPQAGLTQITGSIQTVVTNIGSLEDKTRSDKQRFSYVKSMADASVKRLRALIAQKIETQKISGPEKDEAIDRDIKILNDRIVKINSNLETEREEIKKLRDNSKVQIAQLKTVVKNSAGLIKNLGKTSRDSLNNAKKVYNFVKKVASDNLGKKFLVKIPRATNVNYSPRITKHSDRPWDVIRGPFGFPPQPISSIPDYKGGDEWKVKLTDFKKVAKEAEREGPSPNTLAGSIWPAKSNIHWHYLDIDAMGKASAISSHLVPEGSGYTYGALKTNYNPLSEKWEYNYMPEPQGGFFNFALYHKNLKHGEMKLSGIAESEMPKVTRNVLAPKLMDKIVAENSRIQCYVRYDHSQHLDFGKISSSEIEQQSIDGNGRIIPDVMETSPNLKPDQKNAMNQIEARISDDKDLERQGKSVAFVKCTVDAAFYMAPKTLRCETVVWAEDFTVNLAPTPYEIVYVDGSGEYDGCKVPKEVKRRPIPTFGVKNGGLLKAGTSAASAAGGGGEPECKCTGVQMHGTYTTEEDCVNAGWDWVCKDPDEGTEAKDAHKMPWDCFERHYSETYKGWIINTEEKDLDPEHVYALITVPGRITPTIDKRYVDGPLKSLNGVAIANSMTEDVVKIDEFEKPGINSSPNPIVDCSNLPPGVEFTFEDISRAVEASKAAAKGISLSSNGDNSKLAFTAPSPIYPDVVALPLMSLERCYGPWVSSALDGAMVGMANARYSDIGGKIEFEKDENLAPWSYAGYQLMDEAAKMKTKFSNSLLLFSERGSFSYPTAPVDISLAKALKDKGPLVTSISVDVGANQIKTSVKLDLYTSQFGKLQKQKELAIAQISRERQKIIDQNNLLTRRGIGKGSANMNMLGTLLENGGQKLIDAAKDSNEIFTALEKGEVEKASMITISATPTVQQFDNIAEGISTSLVSEDSEGVFQSESQLQEMASLNNTSQELDSKMAKTAGGSITDVMAGVSDNPHDPNFPSRPVNRRTRTDKRTFNT